MGLRIFYKFKVNLRDFKWKESCQVIVKKIRTVFINKFKENVIYYYFLIYSQNLLEAILNLYLTFLNLLKITIY